MLRSSLLPAEFDHGFTTRVSQAEAPARLYVVRQVHGSDVVLVPEPPPEPAVLAQKPADAVGARTAGIAVGVYTADCVPMLLADPVSGAFAAVHAGWRGTLAGVVAAAVAALTRAFGTRPQDLYAAMGPAIGPCCFEVGRDVAERFDPAYVRPRAGRSGRPTVDLLSANRAALEAAGLPRVRIDGDPPCTSCDPDRFFSFRRDGAAAGRHVAFIGRRET